MHNFLFHVSIYIYFAATIGFLIQIITMRKDVEKVAMAFLAGGFLVQTTSFVLRWLASGHTPLVNMHESLSFLAWCIIGAYFFIHIKYKIKALGAFVTPLALLAIAASSLYSKDIFPLAPALKSYWLPIHATICIASYAFFALAFALALMYLTQEKQIKRKHLGAVFKRLPSLESIDAMNGRCLTFGFPLLTVGIITGSIWAEKAWGAYWSWDPKETWSLITWLLYAALLHQRLTVGWRGRRAALMVIIAFATMIFTFLGVSYFLPGEHSYAKLF